MNTDLKNIFIGMAVATLERLVAGFHPVRDLAKVEDVVGESGSLIGVRVSATGYWIDPAADIDPMESINIPAESREYAVYFSAYSGVSVGMLEGALAQ